MKFLSLLSLALPALTTATILPKCISDADVDTYVGAFQKVLSGAAGLEKVAEKYFAKDMKVISDSDSFFEQLAPLNNTLFPTRDAFVSYIKTKSGAQFNTLFTTRGCDTITWYAEFRPGGIPARAMQVFFIDTSKKQISKIYYEYNTGVLLYLQGCRSGRNITIGTEGVPNYKANCLPTSSGWPF